MKTNNKKYEITDIAHETYPFLHRTRALRDIGENVKAGDLGGFVRENTIWKQNCLTAHGSSMMPLPAAAPM